MGDGDEGGEGGGGEEVREGAGGREAPPSPVESSLPRQVGGAPRVRVGLFYNRASFMIA